MAKPLYRQFRTNRANNLKTRSSSAANSNTSRFTPNLRRNCPNTRTDITAEKGKTPYIVAVADFLNAPDIEHIDLSGYSGRTGDVICILVTDDFSVKAVFVRITNADGTSVKEGYAQPSDYEWTFTDTVANNNLVGDKIEVFAFDTPGNIAHDEQTL